MTLTPKPPVFRPLNIKPVSQDPRRVVRCEGCNLIQFDTQSGRCRRCSVALPPKVIEAKPKSVQQLMGERLSKRIRHELDKEHITTSELARRARLGHTVIHRLIKYPGLPDMATLFNLANAFGVDTAVLWKELEG